MAISLATTLQKLEGTAHELGGLRVRFEESPNGRPAAWAGGEGYAAPVRLFPLGAPASDPRSGGAAGEKHFLKIFRLPSNERRLRATFLSTLELGRLPLRQRPFEAAPVRTVRAVIRAPEEGDIPIEGHLAPSISGKSLASRLQEGWDPSLEMRVALAMELCGAVEVLEGGGLTHGDLSGENVMITDGGGSAPERRIIDFDGFHHERVPPVPYTPKEKGGRAWGTPGYRAPAFKRGPDVVVNSDRVALAVLVVELVTMRHDDDLQRDTFLEQREMDARAPSLPDEITARWPAGWALVQRAVGEDHPSRAPAPADLRKALARLLARPGSIDAHELRAPMSLSPGFLVLVRQAGQQDRQVKLRTVRGSFALVSSELSWLGYQLGHGSVRIWGSAPVVDGRSSPLFVRHGGPRADAQRYDGVVDVDAKFGDVLICDDLQVYLG